MTYPLHGHGFAPGCALPFDPLVRSPLRSPLPGLLLRPMIGTVRPAMRSLLRSPLRIHGKAMGCASIFHMVTMHLSSCFLPASDEPFAYPIAEACNCLLIPLNALLTHSFPNPSLSHGPSLHHRHAWMCHVVMQSNVEVRLLRRTGSGTRQIHSSMGCAWSYSMSH